MTDLAKCQIFRPSKVAKMEPIIAHKTTTLLGFFLGFLQKILLYPNSVCPRSRNTSLAKKYPTADGTDDESSLAERHQQKKSRKKVPSGRISPEPSSSTDRTYIIPIKSINATIPAPSRNCLSRRPQQSIRTTGNIFLTEHTRTGGGRLN